MNMSSVSRMLAVVGSLACVFAAAGAPSALAAGAPPREERVRKEALDELERFRAGVDDLVGDAALSREQARSLDQPFDAMRDAINTDQPNLFARALLRLLATISTLEDQGAVSPGTSISALDLAADVTANLIEIGFLPRDRRDGAEAIDAVSLLAAHPRSVSF
jgi:hypothetical protein